MELLKKYWWIVLLVVIGFALMSRRSGGGGTVQQISSGGDVNQLQSIASSDYQSAEAARLGTVNSILGWFQFNRTLDAAERGQIRQTASDERIATLQSNAEQAVNANQVAWLMQQGNYQYTLQQQALRNQNHQANQNAWLSTLLGGLGIFAPLLTRNGGGGGGGGFGGGGLGGIGGSGNSGIFGSGGGGYNF